jgi:hypothetical protein
MNDRVTRSELARVQDVQAENRLTQQIEHLNPIP